MAVWDASAASGEAEPRRIRHPDYVARRTGSARASSRHTSAGDPHRRRTEEMKTTATVLDEVVINVFSGRLRRQLPLGIARIAEGSA
jgi:hypothetical protein